MLIMSTNPRSSFATVVNFLPYLWPQATDADHKQIKFRLLLSLAFLVGQKAISLSVPLFYGKVMDWVAIENFVLAVALALIGAYAGARLLQQVFDELKHFIFARVAQRSIRLFSTKVYSHLHSLSLQFHLDRATGGVARVIERGSKSIEFLLTFVLFSIIPTLLEVLLVCGVFLLLFGWQFSLIILVTIVGYVVFTIVVTEWRIKFRREMNEYDKQANSRTVDSLLNYETVKYFNAEAIEAEYYNHKMQLYEEAAVRNRTSLSLLNIGQGLIISAGIFLIMALAADGMQRGDYTIGEFAAMNMYLLQLYLPLNFLGTIYREIRRAVTDMEEMFDLLDQPRDIKDAPNAPPLRVDKADIVFDEVSFSYGREAAPVLNKISFKVAAGENVAIVGASGAGKSTITRLLYRFYDPIDGAVYIDGQNIRHCQQDSVRQAIGVVPQDTVLFNETLRYNIEYGQAHISDAKLQRAIRFAGLEQFIAQLPDGLQTMVGERGLKLSGGEKQRVSIARAILKNCAIYVFDEATSSLDSHNEKLVQESLKGIANNYTTITIAHRLSTIMWADKILVLDKGNIVESGTHAQLLQKQGYYYSLWQVQKRVK